MESGVGGGAVQREVVLVFADVAAMQGEEHEGDEDVEEDGDEEGDDEGLGNARTLAEAGLFVECTEGALAG